MAPGFDTTLVAALSTSSPQRRVAPSRSVPTHSAFARLEKSISRAASTLAGWRSTSGVDPDWSTRPRRSRHSVCDNCAASSRSCVTRTTVIPKPACNRLSSTCNRLRVLRSSAEKGSSSSSNRGLRASARAIATRWHWPPESAEGLRLARPPIPTASRPAWASRWRSAPRRCTNAAATFATALRCGKSAYLWPTKPNGR